MRVLHVTSVTTLAPQIRKQLQYERRAAACLQNHCWETLALHTKSPETPFERQVPLIFRPLLLRYLYTWLILIRAARSYDYILLRHLSFDPWGPVLQSFVHDRISVHHAKEQEELLLVRAGFIGRLASLCERMFGAMTVRGSRAVAAVTPEIAQYQSRRCIPPKSYTVYANGIDETETTEAEDKRHSGKVVAVFLCGTFSPWHGLDLLIEAVEEAPSELLKDLTIHLFGHLTAEQSDQLGATAAACATFVAHGRQPFPSWRRILEQSDIGLASFALWRKGLREASTLKVRELLAAGVPVYSGHRDGSLAETFPYYCFQERPNVAGIVNFARSMKSASRAAVRTVSLPQISKATAMTQMLSFLDRNTP